MANLMHHARVQRYAPALHLLRDKALPRLPWLVNALLVLLLAYALAHLTWRAFAPAPLALPANPPVPAAQAAAPQGSTLRQVAGLQIFGRAVPDVAQNAPIEAPDTRLRLTLRGVVAADDPRNAMVIVADESGREQHYFVGASLPGGAVLEQVYPDRVILSRDNRYETLRLPREESAAQRVQSARVVPPVARPAVARNRPAPVVRGDARASGVVQSAEDTESAYTPDDVEGATGASLGDYREQLVRDPQSLWNLVQVHPVLEDGRIKGFTLAPQKDEHLFRAAGWRPGDIITQVNGIAVDDVNALQAVFGQITSADRVALAVERGGASQEIELRFSE